ncbi:MAG: hypothetical protein C4549_03310 [Deltaproteobacteria bacterium]|nr:MAG: hypothetical protein C4549_03310 [Deltaproteobacteria bacterium]
MKVGFVGHPPNDIIEKYRSEELIDLDNDLGQVEEKSDLYLPKISCSVIKRVFNNSLAFRPQKIIFDVGEGKCDSGRFLSWILKDLFNIDIIETRNQNRKGSGTIICDSRLPLREKFDLILNNIIDNKDYELEREPHPSAGFWSVPCWDTRIFDLFPEGTRIFGWTRCFENGTPDDLEIECYVEKDIPTVFYAQTFCSKNLLAKNLARVYRGLYVDCDGRLTTSVKAQIEAFLYLRGTSG